MNTMAGCNPYRVFVLLLGIIVCTIASHIRRRQAQVRSVRRLRYQQERNRQFPVSEEQVGWQTMEKPASY